MKKAIGVDIGGTKTRIAVIDELSNILAEVTIETRPHDGGAVILDRICSEFSKLVNLDEISGIGIGTAGQIGYDGTVLSSTDTFLEWVDLNIEKEVEIRTGIMTRVVNDVQSMALGELYYSSLNSTNMICIALGTGVGGAIVINNKLIRGSFGTTGELGHMVLYPFGKQCPCGGLGCVESYLSGVSVEKSFFELTGTKLTSKEIFQYHPDSVVIQDFYDNLLVFLQTLTNAFSPDLIVLGGGVSKAIEKHLPELNLSLRESVLKSNRNIQLRISALDHNAMIFGAASLILKNSI